MVSERWIGRFIIEYDAVDIEQFMLQAKEQRRSGRALLEEDAIKRAAKAYRGLKKKTVHINGDRNGRAIFATSTFHERTPETLDV